MRTTIEFLDAVRVRHGLTSDYQLAKVLATSQPLISHYRTGRSALGDEMALRVAELLELEPGFVLACIAAERAKRTDVKRAWLKAAKALAAALFGLWLGGLLANGDRGFSLVATATAAHPDYTLCALVAIALAWALGAALTRPRTPRRPSRRPRAPQIAF